jgi:iron uptake system component EfeO
VTGNRTLVSTIQQRFARVGKTLARYRSPTAPGFTLYSAFTRADRLQLAQEIDALAEPLSSVAAKVS